MNFWTKLRFHSEVEMTSDQRDQLAVLKIRRKLVEEELNRNPDDMTVVAWALDEMKLLNDELQQVMKKMKAVPRPLHVVL
jgi:hypothetical protein